MPIEIKIPPVGESITEVQIGNWLKSEGDSIKQDEPLAVVDSEKTTFELPAPESGTLTKILCQAGETVKVGTVVGLLDAEAVSAKPESPASPAPIEIAKKPDESDAAQKKQKKGDETKEAPAPAAPEAPQAKSESTANGSAPARPVVRPEPAAEEDDEAQTALLAPTSAPDREEKIVRMTMLRRTAAQRLVEASQTMAMLTTFNEVDMSSVQALRHDFQESFEKRHQVRLGLMSFFVKAAVEALKQFPQLNAEVRGTDIIYRNYFDLGVAVSTERGLVVPVLRNAERMSFAGIEKAIGDFGKRAKEGRLKPKELEGGTFTITNGGVFGSLLSTPIINPPQSGILGLHSIQERPVAVRGEVVIRPMMYIALTYDHRIVDGREAVLFLRRIKEAVETPTRMLLEV